MLETLQKEIASQMNEYNTLLSYASDTLKQALINAKEGKGIAVKAEEMPLYNKLRHLDYEISRKSNELENLKRFHSPVQGLQEIQTKEVSLEQQFESLVDQYTELYLSASPLLQTAIKTVESGRIQGIAIPPEEIEKYQALRRLKQQINELAKTADPELQELEQNKTNKPMI